MSYCLKDQLRYMKQRDYPAVDALIISTEDLRECKFKMFVSAEMARKKCLSIGRSFADAKTYGFLAGALFFSPLKFSRARFARTRLHSPKPSPKKAPATQANLNIIFIHTLFCRVELGRRDLCVITILGIPQICLGRRNKQCT